MKLAAIVLLGMMSGHAQQDRPQYTHQEIQAAFIVRECVRRDFVPIPNDKGDPDIAAKNRMCATVAIVLAKQFLENDPKYMQSIEKIISDSEAGK